MSDSSKLVFMSKPHPPQWPAPVEEPYAEVQSPEWYQWRQSHAFLSSIPHYVEPEDLAPLTVEDTARLRELVRTAFPAIPPAPVPTQFLPSIIPVQPTAKGEDKPDKSKFVETVEEAVSAPSAQKTSETACTTSLV